MTDRTTEQLLNDADIKVELLNTPLFKGDQIYPYLAKLIKELSAKLREREEQQPRRHYHTTKECRGVTDFYPSDIIDGEFLICKRCKQKVKVPTQYPPKKED